MNIKKLMSTALLLLVGAGSAVAVGDEIPPPAYEPSAYDEAPAVNITESENVGFQSLVDMLSLD